VAPVVLGCAGKIGCAVPILIRQAVDGLALGSIKSIRRSAADSSMSAASRRRCVSSSTSSDFPPVG
jgi:hypothetical protein